LRFPHAFLLFPIGLISIWIFNSVRIAALVSIGAHLAPQVAIQGFHSQGGWITFLLVTISIMVLARRSTYLATAASRRPTTRSRSSVSAYLVPFCALMMSSVILAAAAPNDPPLYPLKIVLVGLAVWFYRDVYRSHRWSISPEAILAGLIVGAAWIASDPGPGEGAGLELWLAGQTAYVMIAWLGLRMLGSVVLVPLAEEMAFRGFLYRWLVSRNFEAVPFGHFAFIPLVASSVMFGALHQRWLAAGLSSVVFTLVMWRTHRLSSAIVAHAVANATICVWAIGFRQWSLL
jgi:exosortase E/protease (VPEID-CTERM system)